MGRMADLDIEVNELLRDGYDARDIAHILGVPLEMIQELVREIEDDMTYLTDDDSGLLG